MDAELDYAHQPSENMISKLWSKYFPYWPIFLLFLLPALGGAWLYLKYKVPVYQSSATLLIKDEKKGTEDSKVVESLNPLSGKKIIENEIEVIKSRALMSEVVNDLKLYAPVFEERKWKDASAYQTSPVKIELRNPDSLTETKKVAFSFDQPANAVKIGDKSYPLNQWVNTSWGTLRFLPNNRNYTFVSPLYFQLVHPKRIVQGMISNMSVSPVSKQSTVVTLSLKDEVPQRSEDVLNGVIKSYNEAAIKDKNSLIASTLDFVDERLDTVTAELSAIEKKLQQYRANKGAIDISSQGQLFLKNVSDNDQKLSDINMRLSVLDQVEQYVSLKDNHAGLVPATLGVDDPLLTGLLDKLYNSEIQYEKLKRTTAENNPMVTALADEIERLKPSVMENIRSQRRGLEASKINLYSTNHTYNSILQALPQQERDLVEISREQNIKSSIYSFLLQKREETALSNSSATSDTRIVDKAESSLDPVGMSGKLVYLAAIILAALLLVVFVSMKESLNSKILFRQEIESMTSFPVIGEIIFEKSDSKLILQGANNSWIAEQFRMLRTSLPFLGIGPKGRKILITSTIAGEGKSFISANLGLSLAITGKKVVLVEFDLSNPTLTSKLNIESKKGVADYLSGFAQITDVIRKTDIDPNLFLVSAGTLPSNPSELILSDRTKDLFSYLEDSFDYIIIDSAPVGILSDGYVLSRLCDATLYVVRHGYTPKKMLQRLEHNNHINELKNIALVFNGIRSRGFGKNGYGFGYGYGYIHQQKRKKALVNI